MFGLKISGSVATNRHIVKHTWFISPTPCRTDAVLLSQTWFEKLGSLTQTVSDKSADDTYCRNVEMIHI